MNQNQVLEKIEQLRELRTQIAEHRAALGNDPKAPGFFEKAKDINALEGKADKLVEELAGFAQAPVDCRECNEAISALESAISKAASDLEGKRQAAEALRRLVPEKGLGLRAAEAPILRDRLLTALRAFDQRESQFVYRHAEML